MAHNHQHPPLAKEGRGSHSNAHTSFTAGKVGTAGLGKNHCTLLRCLLSVKHAPSPLLRHADLNDSEGRRSTTIAACSEKASSPVARSTCWHQLSLFSTRTGDEGSWCSGVRPSLSQSLRGSLIYSITKFAIVPEAPQNIDGSNLLKSLTLGKVEESLPIVMAEFKQCCDPGTDWQGEPTGTVRHLQLYWCTKF